MIVPFRTSCHQPPTRHRALVAALQAGVEAHPERHPALAWAEIGARLPAASEAHDVTGT